MNFFQNLRTRERIFVISAVAVLLLVLLFALVIDPLTAHSARLDRQMITAQRQLRDVHELQQEYLRKKSVIDRINAQLRRQKNFAIFSRLEELGRQTGISDKILSMKPTVSTPSDAYEEEALEIKMEGINLEQLVRFLYQVENSPQFMKIKRLYIKPRFDNRQILSVTFRVSIYTPKDRTT